MENSMMQTGLAKHGGSSALAVATPRPVALGTFTGKQYPDNADWQQILTMAKFAKESGIADSMELKTEAAICMVALKGWELGLPFMTSLEGIRMVKGRPQPAAALMESLAVTRIPGARVDWLEDGSKGRATCIAYRPGRQPIKISYSEADAKKAKVLDKETYQRHPDQLYRAGALRQACWLQYKDLYYGFAPPTEVAEIDDDVEAPIEASGTEVSEAPAASPVPAAPPVAAAPPVPPVAPVAPVAPPAQTVAPATPASVAPTAVDLSGQPGFVAGPTFVSDAPASAPTGGSMAYTPSQPDLGSTPTAPDGPPLGAQPSDASVAPVTAGGEPEDLALPFTKGEYLGRSLASLGEADFRKLIRGYRDAVARNPTALDADLKRTWLGRVEAWAKYRGVSVE